MIILSTAGTADPAAEGGKTLWEETKMIQSLTYVVLVFVLIFKTIFPFGMIRQTTAAETGSLAATAGSVISVK